MEADTREDSGTPESNESVGAQPRAEPAVACATEPEQNDVRQSPEEQDQFYGGVIAEVNWGRGTGVVRSGNGRDIPFEFPLVVVIGERRRIEHLHPGMRVGFDVSWTSKGLRITHLKIYD